MSDTVESVRLTDELGALTVPELEELWNARADHMNRWEELGLDEIVAFAQHEMAKRIAAWVEPQRNDYPAMGVEFANAIRYACST